MLAFSFLLALVAQGDGAAAKGVTSVAVMPLKAQGKVNKDLVGVLDQLVLSQLQAAIGQRVRVVGKSDIDALLGLERTKEAVGCSDATCAVELAGALGVDSIVTGTVGNLGKKRVLSLAWIHQRDGRPIARHSQDLGADEESFDAGVHTAIAALTGASGASPATAAKKIDVTGWWRWDCCGGQYSGFIYLRQAGTQVKGFLTDFSIGSGGTLEGMVDGTSLRFIRRSVKLVQDYKMTLSDDGTSAKGEFDNAGFMQMTRDPTHAAGTPGDGVTGTYRWDCCNKEWWGTLTLAQDKGNVYGILHDERNGSGGFFEGTIKGDELKLKRTITRGANGWQTWTLRRSGHSFVGEHHQANGALAGATNLELLKD